jgi:DNA primase
MKIQDLKQYPITDYLQSLGYKSKREGTRLLYQCPLRTDTNPSLSVTPSINVWTDYANGRRGDIIDLIRYLHDFDFTTACNHLETMATGLNYSPPKNSFYSFGKQDINPKNTITINTVKPLQSNSLIAYCESRKIPFNVAFKFLNEVHYSNNGKSYYSLGFMNDKGGFELRNEKFKGCTTPKGITTFEVPESKTVYLFEGFFDFLSALAFFGTSKPLNTVIVVNSLSCLPHAKERLNKAKTIHTFLDRDSSGLKAVEKLRTDGMDLVDRSVIYEGYKDFNEFLNR